MTISRDVRWRVVRAYLDGENTMQEIADIFKVSSKSVSRWLKIYRTTGEYMTGKVSEGRPRSYTKEDEEAILNLFREQSDLTLEKASDAYFEKTEKRFHTEVISRILQQNGWSRKKRQYLPANKKHPE